jgi:hypothetical protein
VRLWLEERLVNVHLRVAVNAVVGDVEVLNDLWFWKLINNTSTRLLVFDQLAGHLLHRFEKRWSYFLYLREVG